MKFSRRSFLRGAGGTVLSLPYLDYFARTAAAQTPLTRLVVFMHGQGMLMDRWTPSGTGTGYQLSQILAPLEAHREKLTIISGVDNMVRREQRRGNAHNPAGRSLMTCYPFADSMNPDGTIRPDSQQVENGPAFGPSIENVIADRIGQDARFPRYDLRIQDRGTGENQIFWAANQVPIDAEGDPAAAYARLVSEIDPGEVSTPSFADRLRAQRGSVLDAVSDGFAQLMSRVGSDDRARLEAHAAHLRGLEGRVEIPLLEGCAAHAQSLPGGYNASSRDWDHISAAAQIDNMVLALSCNLSRVGTIQFSDYHAPTFPWLDANIPGAWENWHEMVHSGQSDSASREAMTTAFTWYSEQFAYLLDRMDSVIEADGNTLLDNSLVLWISEFGDGGSHDTRQLPVVLAGGLAGAVPGGRHIAADGATTGDLFVTLLQLFGFDDTSFGLQHGGGGNSLISGPIALG